MARYLAKYRNFQECILEEVHWRHFGTVLEFVFDYIWSEDGTVRPEFAPAHRKTIVFQNVQEFHVRNALTEHMCLHPEELDWGLSEVSSMEISDDEQMLAKFQSLPIPLHLARCNWEGERRIEVVFSTLEVD